MIMRTEKISFRFPVIREKGVLRWIVLGLLCLLTAVILFKTAGLDDFFKRELLSYLIRVDTVVSGDSYDAVYILGGGQKSLRAKYKKAAGLYGRGVSKKLYILSRPGSTEYSHKLNRNLTNDEWSIMMLEKYGVPKRAVEPTKIESDAFGTLSEARSVSSIAEEYGWNSLLLITCPRHTRRVQESFHYFLNDTKVDIDVIASENKSSFFEYIAEFIKLKIYQFFLLKE